MFLTAKVGSLNGSLPSVDVVGKSLPVLRILGFQLNQMLIGSKCLDSVLMVVLFTCSMLKPVVHCRYSRPVGANKGKRLKGASQFPSAKED